jgi:uncharacterized protein involved in response to NO
MTDEVAAWRREPYRVLFPLGALLVVVGTFPWALFGLGVGSAWQPVFHAVVQVEGFLMCFGLGFLFTFIPRRTGTWPPSRVEMALAVGFPIGIAVAAGVGVVWMSQLFWAGLMATAGQFVVRRLVAARKAGGPDGALVWVPVALAIGLTGSLFTGLSGVMGSPILHAVGKEMLTQGMFTGLCLGVGRMIIPMFVYGPRPGQGGSRSRLQAAGLHGALALTLAFSFVLEIFAPISVAYALRSFLCLGMVMLSMQLTMLPSQPGLHRWLLWLSAWMLPIGYAVMAAFPQHRTAGEHVLFIGGFASMIIAISAHVVLSHGGYRELLGGRPWQLAGAGLLIAVALVFRFLVSLDPERLRLWVGLAATSFLGAAALWMHLFVPRLRPRRSEP